MYIAMWMYLRTCIRLPLICVHPAYTMWMYLCTCTVLVYMYQSSLETHTLSIYCVDVLVYVLIYVYMVHVDLQKYITYVPVHSLQAKVSLICMYTCKSCTEWIQHETVPYLGSPVEVATK